jgi:heat shock protein HtpX
MRQRGYGKDTGLTIRMFFTSFLLLLLYCFFGLFLFSMGMPLEILLILGIVMVAFQFFASDKLVLASTRARVVSAEEEPKLHAVVERLSALADMPKPKKIAIMDTHVPNAFATGRSPKNSVIAVTRGLLSRLTEKELEAVLAHELSHIKNKDVMVLTWASLIVVISGFLMQMLFWMSIFGGFGGGGRSGRGGGGQAMLVIFAVYIGTILVYFISQLLILTISRYREYAADRGGAILTGSPLTLASALTKISGDLARIPEKDLRTVEHANAFFIIPALSGKSIGNLLSSHPPVEKRIEKLRSMQADLEGPSKYTDG